MSEPAFAWTARFPFVPGLWLQIDDGYARGEGELRGRLWGRVPLFRTSGPETTRGELQRYLAELFWVPHAIASNPSLVWSEASANACTVACSIEPDAAVRFEFDEAGDIAAITATRPRQDGKRFVMTPWRGVVHDYTVFDGVRIPARAEVSWLIGDETFTYWEGRVTSLEFAA